MHKLYLTLTKKVIMLVIITFLPLGLYLYLNEEVQTTFISNIDNNQSKYILDAEFNPTERNINVSEKVVFFNKTNVKMDKIYFYFNNNEIKISDVRINKRQVDYRIIGNKNILMVILNKEIQSGDSVDVDIGFLMDIENRRRVSENGRVINYVLDIWYPVVIHYDNNGWNLKSAINNTPNSLECNHYIRIFIPSGYTIDMTNIKGKETQAKDNGGFFQITEKKVAYLPITIKKSYDKD